MLNSNDFTRRAAAAMAALTPVVAPVVASALASSPARAASGMVRLGGQDIALDVVRGKNEGDDAAARPLILYCGGAGFTRARYGHWVSEALGRYGDVVLWDYPGQGDSSGFPDPLTAERVVRALAAHVRSLAGERPVVVWGHSLGGFVGAQLVRHLDADALVLETTAPDPVEALEATGVRVPDGFRRLVPLLSRYRIPAALRGFGGEVLVFGAGRDRTLPVELARKLADRVSGATYVENKGASHYGTLRERATHEAVEALLARIADG